MSLGSAWLTQPDKDQAERNLESVPGMAHFAGTGPKGALCRGCAFWGDIEAPAHQTSSWHRDRCKKFEQMMREVGQKIPGGTKACKYFESKRKA